MISSLSVLAIGMSGDLSGSLLCCRLLLLHDLLDPALHVEVALGHAVVLAVQDLLEAANGVLDFHLSALAASKHLRRAERLTQEPLNLARPVHSDLVLGREFVHAENGDDV